MEVIKTIGWMKLWLSTIMNTCNSKISTLEFGSMNGGDGFGMRFGIDKGLLAVDNCLGWP